MNLPEKNTKERYKDVSILVLIRRNCRTQLENAYYDFKIKKWIIIYYDQYDSFKERSIRKYEVAEWFYKPTENMIDKDNKYSNNKFTTRVCCI